MAVGEFEAIDEAIIKSESLCPQNELKRQRQSISLPYVLARMPADREYGFCGWCEKDVMVTLVRILLYTSVVVGVFASSFQTSLI
eukprot:scaffold23579_cov99-Cyclotella_meneghiniana.AAC.1